VRLYRPFVEDPLDRLLGSVPPNFSRGCSVNGLTSEQRSMPIRDQYRACLEAVAAATLLAELVGLPAVGVGVGVGVGDAGEVLGAERPGCHKSA
jgi:hypothetical protein